MSILDAPILNVSRPLKLIEWTHYQDSWYLHCAECGDYREVDDQWYTWFSGWRKQAEREIFTRSHLLCTPGEYDIVTGVQLVDYSKMTELQREHLRF